MSHSLTSHSLFHHVGRRANRLKSLLHRAAHCAARWLGQLLQPPSHLALLDPLEPRLLLTTLTWSPQSTNIWNTTNTNWVDSSSTRQSWSSGDDAVFASTASVTIDSGGITAHSVTVNATVTLNGNAATLTTPTLLVNTGKSLTWNNGALAASVATIAGTFTNNSTITSDIYITGTMTNTGTVSRTASYGDVSINGELDSSSGVFNIPVGFICFLYNYGTVILRNSEMNDTNITNAGYFEEIDGTANLLNTYWYGVGINSTGNLTVFDGTLSINATYMDLAGTLYIDGGTLTLNADSIDILAATTLSEGDGGVLNLDGPWTFEYGASLTGSGSQFINLGADGEIIDATYGGADLFTIVGTLDLAGHSITSDVGMTLDGGTITNSDTSDASTVNSALAISNNSSIDATGGIQLAGAVAVGGGQSLTLDGSWSFAGGGGLTIANGGLVTLGSDGSETNATFGDASLFDIAGTLDLGGYAFTSDVGLTLDDGGTLTNSSGTASTINSAITQLGASFIGGSGDMQFTGAISVSGNLTQTGAGTLAFSGITTVNNDAWFILGDAWSFGNGGGLTIAAGGVASLGSDGAFTNSGYGDSSLLTISGTLDLAGYNLSSDVGLTLADGGQITNSDAADPSTLTSDITQSGASDLTTAGSLEIDGNISGSGTLTTAAVNTLTLTGTSSFSGTVDVAAGILNNTGSLSSAAIAVESEGAYSGSGSTTASLMTVTAYATSGTGILLNWTNDGSADSFVVTATTGGVTAFTGYAGGSDSAMLVTGLTVNTPYSFTITGISANGTTRENNTAGAYTGTTDDSGVYTVSLPDAGALHFQSWHSNATGSFSLTTTTVVAGSAEEAIRMALAGSVYSPDNGQTFTPLSLNSFFYYEPSPMPDDSYVGNVFLIDGGIYEQDYIEVAATKVADFSASVQATSPTAARDSATPAIFTITRSGDVSASGTVHFTMSASTSADDYTLTPGDSGALSLTSGVYAYAFAAGQATAYVYLTPGATSSTNYDVTLTLTDSYAGVAAAFGNGVTESQPVSTPLTSDVASIVQDPSAGFSISQNLGNSISYIDSNSTSAANPAELVCDEGGNVTINFGRADWQSGMIYQIYDLTASLLITSGSLPVGGAQVALSLLSGDNIVVQTALDSNNNGVIDSGESSTEQDAYLFADDGPNGPPPSTVLIAGHETPSIKSPDAGWSLDPNFAVPQPDPWKSTISDFVDVRDIYTFSYYWEVDTGPGFIAAGAGSALSGSFTYSTSTSKSWTIGVVGGTGSESPITISASAGYSFSTTLDVSKTVSATAPGEVGYELRAYAIREMVVVHHLRIQNGGRQDPVVLDQFEGAPQATGGTGVIIVRKAI